RLRRHRGNQAQKRRRFRPPRGDDLPGLASSRASRPACRSLGDGRLRETAARLFAHQARHARAQPAARGLGAVRRCHRQSVQRKPAVAEPGLISAYVERLARALEFDPSLSRCVRREVEDHLWEAVSTHPTDDALEAERRAVMNFGDPHVVAAQFAVISLAKQARKVGVGAIAVTTAGLIAMKARLAWYAVMECPARQMGGLAEIVVSIDRYAFWLSVFVGIAGWTYIGSRPIPAAFTPEYRAQLRRFCLVCLATTSALIVSVVSDGVLTSLRLAGMGWSFAALIPFVSMAGEAVGAGLLVMSIRSMSQRMASAGRARLMESL